MSEIIKGLCWAAVMLLLALANRLGLINDANANTMFVVLPAVMVSTMVARRGCRLPWRRA